MPLKTITITKVYLKSALETMPEVLWKPYLQRFAARRCYDAVVSGGRYETGWPVAGRTC